jgi:hypothetical protein
MDGSVSTLAPVFAAGFATRNSWDAFVVGLAASIGAGISMGFAEARRPQPHRARSSLGAATSLYGDAGALGSSASWVGRNPGFRYRRPDRQRVMSRYRHLPPFRLCFMGSSFLKISQAFPFQPHVRH